jgi:hypothetical protein
MKSFSGAVVTKRALVKLIQKLIKHDRYLEELCEQLEDSYDILLRNVPLYSEKRRLVGEIDLLAVRPDGVIDIYEVKCSYRVSKARRQLRKFRKLLSANVQNCFFFCGESQSIEVVI